MNFHTLKILKEKLDKSLITPAEKYWYLAGALDFVFEDGKMVLDLPKNTETKPLINEINKNPWGIDICKEISTQTGIPENILKGNKSRIHPPFAPQILKPEPCKTKPKKYSIESCKTIIMNTLPFGTMSVNEMINYNNIELDCSIYQMMNTAANLLSYEHKILKKPKTHCRGLQYEYSLPSDMPTKIVLNGDIVEQQRRV